MSDPVLGVIGRLGDHALHYAHDGLPVFPVHPSTKAPLTAHGMHDATTDREQVREWWRLYPDASIGHRIAEDVVLLDIDPRHGGDAVWSALIAEHGAMPATRVHYSGRNDQGGHVWFKRPPGKLSTKRLDEWARAHDVGESHGDRHTAGIDLLHHGHRYTILPPSLHAATSKPYHWKGAGLAVVIADCPTWLATLITVEVDDVAPGPEREHPRQPSATSGDSIADWFTSTHSWNDVLEPHGWRCPSGDGDRDGAVWLHPQATTEKSATIRHGCLFVYSPNTPFEVTSDGDPHGLTPFAAWAVLEHGGDQRAAGRAARIERDGERPAHYSPAQFMPTDPVHRDSAAGDTDDEGATSHGWEPTDLLLVTAEGYEAPEPSVLVRSDGVGLFYPGRINALVGESGCGKSWVALSAVAQELLAGRTALYIDLEDHVASLIERLLALGVPIEVVRAQFVYVQPDLGYNTAASAAIERLVVERSIALAVIDSVGEAMALQAQNQNDDDAVARWFRMLPRRIANLGAAVGLCDHIPKAKDAPEGFAIGSQRKRAAIDGAQYRVEMVEAFGRGLKGSARLTCTKDRNGRHPSKQVAALFTLDASDDVYHHSLVQPLPSDGWPTGLMERISKLLEGERSRNKTEIAELVKGKTEYRNQALALLIAHGYVATHAQPGTKAIFHHSLRPFREDEHRAMALLLGGSDDGVEA